MTKHQKEKQARKNAAKDARRTRLTVADAERVQADLRKQEAEANARLAEQCAAMEDEWDAWVAWHNAYTIPRICAGFYLAALKAAKKRLIKSALEDFMDELSSVMQGVIDDAADDGLEEAFDRVADELEAEGYEVPVWAQMEDLEEVKKKVKEGRRKYGNKNDHQTA